MVRIAQAADRDGPEESIFLAGDSNMVICEAVIRGGQPVLDSPLPYQDGTRVQVQVEEQCQCPCEREEVAYARERERLIQKHLGEFVVLYQDELLGPFATYDQAIREGYGRFGDVQIVVKQVEEAEDS
jgi:hypothetical protein